MYFSRACNVYQNVYILNIYSTLYSFFFISLLRILQTSGATKIPRDRVTLEFWKKRKSEEKGSKDRISKVAHKVFTKTRSKLICILQITTWIFYAPYTFRSDAGSPGDGCLSSESGKETSTRPFEMSKVSAQVTLVYPWKQSRANPTALFLFVRGR